jgi:hypothetical protein
MTAAVSVVIPTVGRATLDEAVRSVLAQTAPPLEVLVVADLERLPEDFGWADPRVRVLTTGGGARGNGARQLGVDAARGDAIAFLDDDDFWFPDKLERQLALLADARRRGALAVIGAEIEELDEQGRSAGVIPRRKIAPGQTITDYLFVRREVAWGEAAMNTSALLVDRALLLAVPLERSLRMHQDWDWLVRAGREPRVAFAIADGPLLAYRRQPRGQSVSRGTGWRHSLEWAGAHRERLTAREYGDLLLGVTVSLAVTAGDRRGAWATAGRALRGGRPGPAAIAAAAVQLLLPYRSIRWISRLRGLVAQRRRATVARAWRRTR